MAFTMESLELICESTRERAGRWRAIGPFNKAGFPAQDAPSTRLREGPTDGRTDGQTDGPTDGRTHPLTEMQAHLKMG